MQAVQCSVARLRRDMCAVRRSCWMVTLGMSHAVEDTVPWSHIEKNMTKGSFFEMYLTGVYFVGVVT